MKLNNHYKDNQKSIIIITTVFSILVIMTNSNTRTTHAVMTTTTNSTNTADISISHNNTSNAKDNPAQLSNTSSSLILVKPSSLEEEHKKIHEKLNEILRSSGNTAKVAIEAQTLLRPHFEKEEQLSIPVLGALQPYVNGTLNQAAKSQAIQISQQFKKEYPTMLHEHKQIVAALENLKAAAIKENRQDVLTFIEELKGHAANEEQITYPATIVIGELLQLKK